MLCHKKEQPNETVKYLLGLSKHDTGSWTALSLQSVLNSRCVAKSDIVHTAT